MGEIKTKTNAIKKICDLLYLSHSKVPTEWVVGLLFFADSLDEASLLQVKKVLQENKVFKLEGLTWEWTRSIIEEMRFQKQE